MAEREDVKYSLSNDKSYWQEGSTQQLDRLPEKSKTKLLGKMAIQIIEKSLSADTGCGVHGVVT